MLVKLSTGVNFTNVLRAAFPLIFFWLKKCLHKRLGEKSCKKTLKHKKYLVKLKIGHEREPFDHFHRRTRSISTSRLGLSRQGVNFINILRAAFAPVDPKSIKRYWQLDWILTLLWATGIELKYVGEIEPRCQFHQHFTCAFCTNIFVHQKITKQKCN